MELFVPHYELRDDCIFPIEGKPARRLSMEGVYYHAPGERDRKRDFPPAVAAFHRAGLNGPGAILGFANSYGALGAVVWNPWDGFSRFPEGGTAGQAAEVLGTLEAERLLRLCKERPKPLDVADVSDLPQAVESEPTPLTISLWVPEPVEVWFSAWEDFWSLFLLLTSLQLLLLERHGLPAVRAEAGEYALEQLEALRMGLVGLLAGRTRPEFQDWLLSDWGTEFPVEQRLVETLRLIERLSRACVAASGMGLRPKDDLLGYAWDANPPCLLNVLYLSMMQSFLHHVPKKCALPDCTDLASSDSAWCTKEHANLHRQRRLTAKRKYGLSPAEVKEVEAAVRRHAISHDIAAARVVAPRSPAPAAAESPPRGRRAARTSRPSR